MLSYLNKDILTGSNILLHLPFLSFRSGSKMLLIRTYISWNFVLSDLFHKPWSIGPRDTVSLNPEILTFERWMDFISFSISFLFSLKNPNSEYQSVDFPLMDRSSINEMETWRPRYKYVNLDLLTKTRSVCPFEREYNRSITSSLFLTASPIFACSESLRPLSRSDDI